MIRKILTTAGLLAILAAPACNKPDSNVKTATYTDRIGKQVECTQDGNTLTAGIPATQDPKVMKTHVKVDRETGERLEYHGLTAERIEEWKKGCMRKIDEYSSRGEK